MTSSIFSVKYKAFRELLCKSRRDASMTQLELADKLGKPQSYVSKYESGERRIDFIEFLEIAESLEFDPKEFIDNLEGKS